MCKEVNDFSKLAELLEDVEIPDAEQTEETEYKTSGKSEIVTIVAYLLGLKEEHFDEFFGANNVELAMTLKASPEANVIRDICILRNQLLNNYTATNSDIMFNMGNINRMDWFSQDAIRRLEKAKIPIVQANYKADDYSAHFTKLIAEHIRACECLFPDWVKFDYIRDLFYNPNYNKNGVLKKEFAQYHENRQLYPYHLYMNWKPEEVGNLLISDGKFVRTVYMQHGERFTDSSKLHDAVEHTKQSIYDFIDRSRRAVIVVDCENSDVFKLYGVLKNLNRDEVEKIEKIVLYDDYHTTNAWTWLKNFTNIPIEYEEVERVTDHKSLVDIKMTAGVCKAYYQDDIDSFILCSSDSDFWGLISSLPQAKFLVMYEYSKCGQAIKDALDTRSIFYCSMDDFFTGNAGDLQKAVLRYELRQRAGSVIGRNAMDITREIYEDTHIAATEAEMKRFCDKYVKSIRLKLDAEGTFYVEVTEG